MDKSLTPLGCFFGALFMVVLWAGVLAGVLAAVEIMLTHPPDQAIQALEDLQADPNRALTPWVLAGSLAAAQVGLVAASTVLARQLDDEGVGMPAILGLSSNGTWPWWAAAGAGALTVGLLPGWLATRLAELMPSFAGAMETLALNIGTASTPSRLMLVTAIVALAPIGEELAFRGYLWHQLERFLPGWGVWVGTSIIFAAYHLDPIQSPCLVPTALFLGWLRWWSGSVVPAMLAHMVNNVLATLSMLAVSGEVESTGIPLWVALLGTASTVLCCGLAAWWEARCRR